MRDLFELMHCEFCQYQLEILPIREVVVDSIGTKDQCFQNQLRDRADKRCQSHLIHLVGCFDNYYQIPKLVSPFRGEKF